MTFLDALILFWMFAAFWMWWRAFKYKKKVRQMNREGWGLVGGGYARALMDEGYDKGEAVSRAKDFLTEHGPA